MFDPNLEAPGAWEIELAGGFAASCAIDLPVADAGAELLSAAIGPQCEHRAPYGEDCGGYDQCAATVAIPAP